MTKRQLYALDDKFIKRLQNSQEERDKTRQIILDSEATLKKDWTRLAEMNDEDRNFTIIFAAFVARTKGILESIESEL